MARRNEGPSRGKSSRRSAGGPGRAKRKKRKGTSRRAAREAPAAPTDRAAGAADGPGRRGWLPHLLAVFVLFHLAANGLSVLPNVARALDRRAWTDQRIQDEMQTWSGRLGVAQADLEAQLFALASGYHEVRARLLAPFDPYMRVAGLRQSWLMFNAGTKRSDRFAVFVRECPLADDGCDWEPLYLHADPTLPWRRETLGHPRVRSLVHRWGWPSYQARYERGCRAIAGLVLDDFEDAAAVKCAFHRTRLRAPDHPEPSAPEIGREVVLRREEVR